MISVNDTFLNDIRTYSMTFGFLMPSISCINIYMESSICVHHIVGICKIW